MWHDHKYTRDVEEKIFSVLRRYHTEVDYASLQRTSFDFLLHHRLQKIIEEEPSIEVTLSKNEKYRVFFGQIFVDRPYIIDEKREIKYVMPLECRLRELTYSSVLSINISTQLISIDEASGEETVKEEKTYFKQFLARIPMMVGCSKCNTYQLTRKEWESQGECRWDYGGYFIIKGKERVLVAQERVNYNMVHVFDPKQNTKYSNVAEIRSISDETGHSVLILLKMVRQENRCYLSIPYLTQEVHLGYIFRAFGYEPNEILNLLMAQFSSEILHQYPKIGYAIQNIVKDAILIGSKKNAIFYLTQFSSYHLTKDRRVYYIEQVLCNELFPHLGIASSVHKKVAFVAHMFSKLILTEMGVRKHDDRDNVQNKRLETSGILVGELFRTLYKRFVRSLDGQLQKRPDILIVMSRFNQITQGLKHCFSTGNWGIPKSNYVRTGVSQVLSRMTFNATLSHLNRVLIPIGKEGKNTKIRQLHPTHFGFFDAHETPEGHCLDGASRVLMADGSWVPIATLEKDYWGREVLALNIETNSIIQCSIVSFSSKARNTTSYVIDTQVQSVEATGMHPFWVYSCDIGGCLWKNAQDLNSNDLVAVDAFSRFRWHPPSSSEITKAAEMFLFNVLQTSFFLYRRAEDVLRTSAIADVLVKLGFITVSLSVMNIEKMTFRFMINFVSEEKRFEFWLLVFEMMGATFPSTKEAAVLAYYGSIDRQVLHNTRFKDNMLFVPFEKEERVTSTPKTFYDIEIDHPCHNFICEGFIVHNSAGIVKNLSLMTRVTHRFDTIVLVMILEKIPDIDMNFEKKDVFHQNRYKILLNGNWIGRTENADGVFQTLRDYKSSNRIPSSVSISRKDAEKEILLFSDEGRMIRPFLDKTNMPTLEQLQNSSWDDLVEKKWIHYLDSYEIEDEWLALWPYEIRDPKQQRFVDVHPSLILGICTSLIPYPEHTQAPRLCYEASMGKQAIGVYASTNPVRCDTIAHVLCIPERPIVQTHYGEFLGYNDLPCGNNLIVAIASYSGFNQEDSLIFNRSSIERGVFRSFSYRTLVIEEKKKTSTTMECIGLPPPAIRNKTYQYSKLDSNGIVRPHVFVGVGDVIVGKMCTRQQKSNLQGQMSDVSVTIKNGEEGFIDRIFVTLSVDGYRIVKIKIRTLKVLELGDKLASRNAQKGVIGMVLPAEDMPFSTQTGMIPDLIMNPHAIPSRMTINQLLESVAAKSAVQRGEFAYSTAFTTHSQDIAEEISQNLLDCGFQKHGNEKMMNGMTGQMLEADIFMGPTYYLRLKHLVSNKIHARNNGNVQTLCRQPLEGRSKDGGLRFGEMERDCGSYSTPISLKCGLAVQLGSMEDKNYHVLGWNGEGIIPSRQVAFLDKGERECVRITLEDGRTLVCTPDHRFMTSDGTWVMAKDLGTNASKLKCSVNYPLANFEEEILECNGWTLEIDSGRIVLRTDTETELLRTFAFMRILGLMVTDGTIAKTRNSFNYYVGHVTVGHAIDVSTVLDDISWFEEPVHQDSERYFVQDRIYSCYKIQIPYGLMQAIVTISGVLVGKRIEQPSTLPDFVLKEDCPRPIVREFLGAMFGGDGHTCILGMHRGKRDILTSLSFSKTRITSHTESLVQMMRDIMKLLNKCGIHNMTIQELKETSISKKKQKDQPAQHHRSYQSTLHLDISEVIPFHEKVGFRHCSHKTVRLEAAVAYRRLRENVVRQHNWIVNRVDQLTHFSEIKKKDPNKIVGTKKAILQAVEELKDTEPLLHDYAIPSTHDITDHLVKGTQFGKFTSKHFPTAEEFLKQVGAYSWFINEEDPSKIAYGTCRSQPCLPSMDLTVLDVRPCGLQKVCDIEVDRTNSFLAEGVVAHNCMISHGLSSFLKERLHDMSDPFQVPCCESCGFMVNRRQKCDQCQGSSTTIVAIPYACKLLFQELTAMGIRINLLPQKFT